MEKKITGKESLELEKKISGKEVSGKEVSGKERRKQILELIRQSFAPLSGAKLGQLTGVSRQVVVQDIALLRTEGHEIISTARGYILPAEEKCVSRKFKVYHTDERMEEELNTIVDLGGAVQDVMVNHRTYGKVSAELQIRSRRDVQNFLEQIRSGKSTPLLRITSGYHFHTVNAESEEIMDEIEEALRSKGFLADVLPYEKEEL